MDSLAQIVPPGAAENPYSWFLVLVLGAVTYLAKRYLDDKDAQIQRCDAHEDTLLAADGEKTLTLRELTRVAAESADLTEKAVGLITGGVATVTDNNRKLDQLLVMTAAMAKSQDRTERDTARRSAPPKAP